MSTARTDGPPVPRWPHQRLAELAAGTRALAAAGLLRPMRPDTLARAVLAVARDGFSPAAAYGVAAVRYPDAVALVDDRGTLTFAQVARHIADLASVLEASGVGPGHRVGVLCRNHRGFVLTSAALSSLGSDVVLLSVEATATEVGAVAASQRLDLVVHDDEFDSRFLGRRRTLGPATAAWASGRTDGPAP